LDAPRQLFVEVDEGRCTGVGYCEVCAPAVFQLDARRIARVLDSNGADEATIMEAAQKCPVDAIIVETTDGTILWPR
jgi:ferredoxin